MEIRVESSVFEERSVVKTFDRDFQADTFSEETMTFDNLQIKGHVRCLQLDRFCMIIQDLQVTRDYSVNFCGDCPFLKFHFELEGDYLLTPADPAGPVLSIPGGHFNMFYLPEPKGSVTFRPASRKTLEVLFTEEFLKRTVGENYSGLLSELRSSLQKKKGFLLWEESRPIPTELQQHLREIISCRYCGHIKKIYLEARITALLINFLVDDSDLEEQERTPSRVEGTGLLKVEEHIRKNFRESITIAELAPIAGLNTTKLKQSFKETYSTTIYKYITRLRMERAKELISGEDLSVSEAAYEVGYKNPQHFTVAFKKFYGSLPSSLARPNK